MTSTTTETTSEQLNRPATTHPDGPESGTVQPGTVQWRDPRELTDVAVLLANGRLAPRRFASRAEAEAWARADDGEEVVELNTVCQCDL